MCVGGGDEKGVAALVSGVALDEKETAVEASFRISGTPITVPSAVFLVMAMVRFVSGGIVSRTAWGRIT